MGEGSSLRGIFLALAGIGLLGLDAATKWLVALSLPLIGTSSLAFPYGGIGILNAGLQLSIVHAINHGAVWGAFDQFQVPLLLVRIALVIGLGLFLCFFNKRPARQIPLMILLAGAVGNIVDYFFYGHVIDMLYFRFWGWSYPVFNLADTYIFIGVAWLLVLTFSEKKDVPTTTR